MRPGKTGIALRIAAWLFGLLLLLAAISIALAGYALLTEHGSRHLWRSAVWLLQGHLEGEYVAGSLAHGLQLRNVHYQDKDTDLRIDRLDGRWQLFIGQRRLDVAYLHAGNVTLRLQPTPSKPLLLPQDLRLPVTLDLHALSLQKLVILQGTGSTELSALALHGSIGNDKHLLQVDSLQTPFGAVAGNIGLSAQRPFAVDGAVELRGDYQQEHYRASAVLSGSLEKLGIALTADGGKLAGSAQIAATPFAAIPLERALISIDHLNPKAFNAAAPVADIALRADLRPVTPAASAVPAPLTVAGPITLVNATPGRIDADRLPLQSLAADVLLDAEHQQLTRLAIKLMNGGSISGKGNLAPGSDTSDTQALAGQFDLQVEALDLQALHSAMRPTRLRGPVAVILKDHTEQITLALTDPTLAAQLDVLIDAERVQVRSARISEGKAQLEFSGKLAQGGDMLYDAKGSVRNFDPAAFMKTTGAGAPHANINMDFNVSGALVPQARVKLQFGVIDSTYDRLPMTGKGTLELLGTRLLSSDVALLVAGNRLSAKGGFGGEKDSLAVHIDAPQLQRLGYGLDGLLKLDGQLSGSLQRPAARATFQARQLAFGDYHLASAGGNLDVAGELRQTASNGKNGNSGSSGSNSNMTASRLNLQLTASGLRSPELNLANLRASLSGNFAAHTLQLDADGTLHNRPLALTANLQGGLVDLRGKTSWRGRLNTLRNTGVPKIALQNPVDADIGDDHLVLGRTRLAVADTTLDLDDFSYRQGRIHSQGSVQALKLDAVLTLLRQFDIAVPAVKTDLVVDSRWNFTLGDTASGNFTLDRKSGDAVINVGDIEVPLGLSAVSLRADLQNSGIGFTAAVQAARIGHIDGRGTLALIRQDGLLMLTPASALSARINLNVPNLSGVGALLGPSVALKGAMTAQLDAVGTLAQPKLSGAVNGDALAVTFYDQGIQLQDGTVRLTMNENVIDLRQFEFHGGKGTLRGTGQVQLATSNGSGNPDLNATLVADHLALFASPDRQLMLSGQAAIGSREGQMHIDGKLSVDHGLFDLPKSSAPKLGDDVVIVRNDGKTRAGAQASDKEKLARTTEKPAGRFAPVIDILLDLGNDFRFRGGGADLRLVGSLNVKSAPYTPLRGLGTIRVAEGTYETFGVKLAIERGIINFQGPIDNPNINLLAMRRNQDVPAGVEVTGNVNAPRVRLVSEPNVSEEEKLSWIMFGQSSNTGIGQRGASNEALALLGNFGGKKIAKGVGLDQFSIGSSESGITAVSGEQFVNLGKAISEKFMLGYEQSLTGAQSVAKVTYQLSRSWSVLVRGGTINSLNLLFSRRYD